MNVLLLLDVRDYPAVEEKTGTVLFGPRLQVSRTAKGLIIVNIRRLGGEGPFFNLQKPQLKVPSFQIFQEEPISRRSLEFVLIQIYDRATVRWR